MTENVELAVDVQNLTKKYGKITALDGVSLQVGAGELFGLLGVNGAGKTTLIKVLCGLTEPTDGEAYVFGKSVRTQMADIKKVVDLSPQETSVAPRLTVAENLNFFATLYYADKQSAVSAVEKVVENFGLNEIMSRRAGTLSGGWQRRLSIAAALVSEPKLLFLDEPTLGLDVIARRELWKAIETLRGKTTVVLTSHYLEEIEALCGKIAIMCAGKVVATGTAESLKEESGEKSFEDAFIKIAGGGRL